MSAHEEGARYKIGDCVEFKRKSLYGKLKYKVDFIDRDAKGKRWYILKTGRGKMKGGMYTASDLRLIKMKGEK